jgi:hypothetical protein
MGLANVTRRDGANYGYYQLQTVPISQTAGTQTLVAAQTGLYIAVIGVVVGMAAAGTVEFAALAGTTVVPVTGTIPLATNGTFAVQGSVDSPLFVVAAGDGLALVAATGGAYGWINYIVGP